MKSNSQWEVSTKITVEDTEPIGTTWNPLAIKSLKIWTCCNLHNIQFFLNSVSKQITFLKYWVVCHSQHLKERKWNFLSFETKTQKGKVACPRSQESRCGHSSVLFPPNSSASLNNYLNIVMHLIKLYSLGLIWMSNFAYLQLSSETNLEYWGGKKAILCPHNFNELDFFSKTLA